MRHRQGIAGATDVPNDGFNADARDELALLVQGGEVGMEDEEVLLRGAPRAGAAVRRGRLLLVRAGASVSFAKPS